MDSDYRLSHRAPGPEDDGTTVSLDRIGSRDDDVFPPDVLQNPQRYGLSFDASKVALDEARGNPEAQIRVWRAVPEDVSKINPGDWVALSKEYATAESLAEGSRVISATVRAGDLWSEGLLEEWGYQGTITLQHEPVQHIRESVRSSFPQGRGNQSVENLSPISGSVAERALMKDQAASIKD